MAHISASVTVIHTISVQRGPSGHHLTYPTKWCPPISSGNQSVRYAEKCASDSRKGSSNSPPEFKQLLVEASFEPDVSILKLVLENGINASLLFKWREGKRPLPSSESPQRLPVTRDASAVQPESPAENPETLSISCEVTFRHGTLRLNGTVSEKLLTLLIQELKR